MKIVTPENPNLNDRIKNNLKKILSDENSYEKFREDMKKYCSYCAKKEAEAYTTESELAKKVLKTNKTLNIDAFAMYYDMLSQALNQ